jgi:hypothetical protein
VDDLYSDSFAAEMAKLDEAIDNLKFVDQALQTRPKKKVVVELSSSATPSTKRLPAPLSSLLAKRPRTTLSSEPARPDAAAALLAAIDTYMASPASQPARSNAHFADLQAPSDGLRSFTSSSNTQAVCRAQSPLFTAHRMQYPTAPSTQEAPSSASHGHTNPALDIPALLATPVEALQALAPSVNDMRPAPDSPAPGSPAPDSSSLDATSGSTYEPGVSE